MITRIFRATIHRELHNEFEEKFLSISIPLVRSMKGNLSVSAGRPTKWSPDEYLLISTWESEQDIIGMAGENWNQAHIPAGMEKYIKECWIHHYEEFR